jgi:exonuclease SbcC
MRILKVSLERIKSYDDKTTIHLDRGVTAILGENGAGKSTIAQAIGFALFDKLDITHREFVREGENSGTVWVTFETNDGETFTVQRNAGRSGYTVTDEDAGAELEHDTNDEVVDWLERQFGIDGEGSVELSTLWRRCIGVPQTQFLSDFADTASNRESHFDPLLGVDVYEDAWGDGSGTTLKDPVDELKARRRTAKNRITTLEDRVSGIDETREEVGSLESEVGDLEDKQRTIRDELGSWLVEFYHLNEVKEQREETQDDLEEVTESLEQHRAEVEDAYIFLEDARRAQKVVEEAEPGFEAYKEAEDELKRLQEQKQERQELEKEIQTQREEYISIRGEFNQASDNAETAREAKEELEATEESAERYEQLEDEIQSADDPDKQLQEIDKRLGEIEDEDLPGAREDLREQLETVHDLEEKQDTAEKVDQYDRRETELSQQLQRLGSQYENLVDRRERLQSADSDNGDSSTVTTTTPESEHNHSDSQAVAACPTCGRSLDAEQRREILDDIEAEIEVKIEAIHETARDHRAVVADLNRAETASRQVSSLDAERGILRDRIEKTEELERERRELESQREDVVEAAQRLERLKDELESLESDYQAHQEARITYKNNKAALETEQSKLTKMRSEAHELALLERELQTYDGLEEKIREQESIKEENEEDYRIYTEQQEIAAEEDEWLEKLMNLYDEIEEPERRRRKLEDRLATLEDEFDRTRYDTLDRKINNRMQDRARVETKLQTKREQYKEAKEKLERLEATHDQLQRWKETHMQLERDITFATSVREGVRDAGPKMRELLATRIGDRANSIYQTLRGTGRESLTWDETYQITVHDGTQEKTFPNLSGGEKMAAALAVRLAIMEQISPVGLAVLDEPTANLDAQKKDNLVNELERLDAFDQLLVVSHDDTFEDMTEYTIRLSKSDRTTEVVADARGERVADGSRESPQEAE